MEKTASLEITAEEQGLLLRTLKWLIDKQAEMPFTNWPAQYWLANGLRQKIWKLEI